MASARRRGPKSPADFARVRAWLQRPDVQSELANLERNLSLGLGGEATEERLQQLHEAIFGERVTFDLSAWREANADLMPKPQPPPAKSTRGKRYGTTDDAVYDAVARALASGVTGLGRSAEANRPAMGYGLWRDKQPDRDDLPSVRRIRQLFGPRQTKRDGDTWAAVIRLGRKAGRIPQP